MNTATKNLEKDHIHILRLIQVMEKIAGSETPDIEHVTEVVDLIRKFADGLHHAKEEDLFFPMLVLKGFSNQNGPVAVMLHEHVEGRNFVKGISDNIALHIKGDKSATHEIRKNMLGYAKLLQSHISKENNILFRMADNVLSEADHSELLAGFESAEKNSDSTNGSEGFFRRIEGLALFYGI